MVPGREVGEYFVSSSKLCWQRQQKQQQQHTLNTWHADYRENSQGELRVPPIGGDSSVAGRADHRHTATAVQDVAMLLVSAVTVAKPSVNAARP